MNTALIIGRDHLVGLEALQLPDGSWSFDWVHLHRRRGVVEVLRQGAPTTDIAKLVTAIGVRYPLVLVVRGDRMIVRDMPGVFVAERDLGKLLPNAQATELIHSNYTIGDRSLVMVARQQPVNELLSALQSAGFRPLQLIVGPGVLFALREQWTATANGGFFGPHHFEQDGTHAWNYRHVENDAEPVPFADELIASGKLCALSACWQHWFGTLDASTSFLPIVTQCASEEKHRLRYEVGVVALFALLVLMLGADVLLRQRSDGRAAQLQEYLAQRSSRQAQLDSLETALGSRKELMHLIGGGINGSTMRSLDRVTASVPRSVLLTDLWLAPAEHLPREGELFKPTPGLITITGSTHDPAELPSWIAILKELHGVRHARLRSLEQGNDHGDPVFHIEIELG